MITKKPYIQINAAGKIKNKIIYNWQLYSGNGVLIACSKKWWSRIKACRSSAHRAGITLGLEVRNEK